MAQEVISPTTPRADRWSFELIDLTRPLTEQTAYALLGDIAAGEANKHYSQVSVTYDREWSTSNGTLCHLSLPDHVGTHMDAPIHCWEPGVTLEKVDISRLIGEAVCLDMLKGDVDYGYTVADFEDGDVKRTTTEVEHGNGFVLLLVKPVGQSGGRGLIDDALHFETGDLAGILGRLALRIVEICGNRDDGCRHLFTEVCFGRLLQLCKNSR